MACCRITKSFRDAAGRADRAQWHEGSLWHNKKISIMFSLHLGKIRITYKKVSL